MSSERPTIGELWRGRRLFRLDINSKLSVLLFTTSFTLLGWFVAVLFASGRSGPMVAAMWALGALAGLACGLALSATLVSYGVKRAPTNVQLGHFDGVSVEGVTLRRSRPDDAALLPSTVDRLVEEANGFGPKTMQDLQFALQSDFFRTNLFRATIVASDTGEVLGFASFNRLHSDGRPEAGFWLGPEARGQGVAPKVVRALGIAASDHGYPQVWFGTKTDNTRMKRTLESVGAEHDRDDYHRLPNGQLAPASWYLLTASDVL